MKIIKLNGRMNGKQGGIKKYTGKKIIRKKIPLFRIDNGNSQYTLLIRRKHI